MKRWTKRRMYGVSREGVGMIAGTLAYSRKAAIRYFMEGDYPSKEWENFKADGYRTVAAQVAIIRNTPARP